MTDRTYKLIVIGLVSFIGFSVFLLLSGTIPPEIHANIKEFQTIIAALIAVFAAILTSATIYFSTVLSNRYKEAERNEKLTSNRRLAYIYINQAFSRIFYLLESELSIADIRNTLPSELFDRELVSALPTEDVDHVAAVLDRLETYLRLAEHKDQHIRAIADQIQPKLYDLMQDFAKEPLAEIFPVPKSPYSHRETSEQP